MKKITKVIMVLIAVLALALVVSCSKNSADSSAASSAASSTAASSAASSSAAAAPAAPAVVDYASMSLDALKKEIKTKVKGVLTVATSPDYAPYEFYLVEDNSKPELAGFDMSLTAYIADFLGLELDVIPMDFDGVLAEIQMGNVDFGIAGLSPTEERAETMDFSEIYYAGTQAFICLKENASMFTTLEDTNKYNYKVGAQIGSIQVGLAEQYSPNADLVQLSKVTDIIAEVLNGKLDGAYVELAVAESYAKNYPELCAALDVPFDSEGNVIGIKKGNAALVEGVNRAIAQVLADGTMDDFVALATEQATGNIIEGLLD